MPDSTVSANSLTADPSHAQFPASVLAALRAQLRALPPPSALWVAFSGGRDSLVLLDTLAELRASLPAPLFAAHVDHGLAADRRIWAMRCAAEAEARAVPFREFTITSRPSAGDSLEAWARAERYALLAAQLPAGGVLLTAHHEDDQAETFLLNALRGAGPRGLRGIAPRRRLGAGWVVRPLLNCPGEAVARWAAQRGLQGIEDPMNADRRHARNFLRHEVLPLLRKRWPAVATVLARDARHQARLAEGLERAAEALLSEVTDATGLRWRALVNLPSTLARDVFTLWLAQHGLHMPNDRQWHQIARDFLHSRPDRQPALGMGATVLRRYREHFCLVASVSDKAPLADQRWWADQPLMLAVGVLRALPVTGEGLAARFIRAGVKVRARRGGERCRLPGRAHHSAVKKILQAAGVPPWLRANLPLLYVGETLAAIGDLLVCEGFAAGPGEPGFKLSFELTGLTPDTQAWQHSRIDSAAHPAPPVIPHA